MSLIYESIYHDITFSYKLISLLGNIGGTLGLCVGISLLTIVEVFELIIEITAIMFKNRNL